MADYSEALDAARVKFYRTAYNAAKEYLCQYKHMFPNTNSPIAILRRMANIGGFCAFVRDAVCASSCGFPTELGSGYYSSVYDLTHDKVLKISYHRDAGYQSFVQFCYDNESKHLPRIYEEGEWLGLKYYVLEKLKPMDEEKPTPEYHWLSFYIRYKERGFLLGIELIKTILKLGPLVDDLHDENIMYRHDGTLVITDPCCSEGSY